MAPNLLFYQLLVIALVVICLLSHVWWPHPPRAMPQMPHKPDKPRRKRSTAPKPFPGLIHQPLCAVCEQGADTGPKAPGAPPPILTCTRGRRRTVDTQVQLDELFALLSAVKAGQVSTAKAIERLERSPQWVWVAMDTESKLLLALDVGDRTLAMAQRVVHQVAQVLAPDLCPAVSHRWVQGVSDGLADPLWILGAITAPAGARPSAQAALDAAPAAALGASVQDRA